MVQFRSHLFPFRRDRWVSRYSISQTLSQPILPKHLVKVTGSRIYVQNTRLPIVTYLRDVNVDDPELRQGDGDWLTGHRGSFWFADGSYPVDPLNRDSDGDATDASFGQWSDNDDDNDARMVTIPIPCSSHHRNRSVHLGMSRS